MDTRDVLHMQLRTSFTKLEKAYFSFSLVRPSHTGSGLRNTLEAWEEVKKEIDEVIERSIDIHFSTQVGQFPVLVRKSAKNWQQIIKFVFDKYLGTYSNPFLPYELIQKGIASDPSLKTIDMERFRPDNEFDSTEVKQVDIAISAVILFQALGALKENEELPEDTITNAFIELTRKTISPSSRFELYEELLQFFTE